MRTRQAITDQKAKRFAYCRMEKVLQGSDVMSARFFMEYDASQDAVRNVDPSS